MKLHDIKKLLPDLRLPSSAYLQCRFYPLIQAAQVRHILSTVEGSSRAQVPAATMIMRSGLRIPYRPHQ